MHLLNFLAHERSGKPVGKYPSEEEDRLRPSGAWKQFWEAAKVEDQRPACVGHRENALIKAVVGVK